MRMAKKKSIDKKILLIGSLILFAFLFFGFIIIPIFQTGVAETQFPDTDSFAPQELYPNQQVAPECRGYSTLKYVSGLRPTPEFCGGNGGQTSTCVGINYFGYSQPLNDILRDGISVGTFTNGIFEDNNVRIGETPGFGAVSTSKNYFNIISNFSCDISEIFEGADNQIECSFLSNRNQNVDILAFVGSEGTDKIDDLRSLSRTYIMQNGLNTITFTIPIELIENENYYLFFTILDPKKWESSFVYGLSNQCTFYQQMQGMKMEKIPFSIIPKPLYLNKQPSQSCPIGYTESSTANTLCVRDNIKDLPCYKNPAPITVNYTYACGSDGQWIQILYKPANCKVNRCETGFKCEETSGSCIAEQLYNDIFGQCTIATDCPNICSNIGNVEVSCVNSICKYSNSCIVQQEELIDLIEEYGYDITNEKLYFDIFTLKDLVFIVLGIISLAWGIFEFVIKKRKK